MNAIYPFDPLKLICNVERFVHAAPVNHFLGEQLHPVNTGSVDLCQVLIQFAGQKQIVEQHWALLN